MLQEYVHYWYIDAEGKGKCKKCGAIRDFRALLARQRNKVEWFYIPTKLAGWNNPKSKHSQPVCE